MIPTERRFIRQAELYLRVTAILSIIFASLGLGLFGFSNYFENLFENLEEAKRRSAASECLEFLAPHALVVDGQVYCYVTIQGNEMVAPIEALRYEEEK